jgi:hypothetical protein
MANSRAKEVSESYKGSEIAFDKTTSGAVAKGYAATNVQAALEEAKPVAATTTAAGIVRAATDAESSTGANVNAYVQPDQLAAKVKDYADTVVIPKIPAVPPVPTAYWGGNGSSAQMQTTYANAPAGTIVVFNEAYTESYGTGNGTGYRTAYRRRTLAKTANAGWQWVQ